MHWYAIDVWVGLARRKDAEQLVALHGPAVLDAIRECTGRSRQICGKYKREPSEPLDLGFYLSPMGVKEIHASLAVQRRERERQDYERRAAEEAERCRPEREARQQAEREREEQLLADVGHVKAQILNALPDVVRPFAMVDGAELKMQLREHTTDSVAAHYVRMVSALLAKYSSIVEHRRANRPLSVLRELREWGSQRPDELPSSSLVPRS